MNSPKFLYIIFLKVFAEKEMSFIPITFLQMSNFVKFAILDAKIVIGELSCSLSWDKVSLLRIITVLLLGVAP